MPDRTVPVPEAIRREATRWFRWLPLALLLYPVAGAATGRSEVATVLGRYSPLFAAMVGLVLAFGATWWWAARSRRPRLEQFAILALALVTYALPGSNQVQRLPLVGYVLPLVRLTAAIALVLIELEIARRRDGRGGRLLGVATVLGLLAMVDLGLAILFRSQPVHARADDTKFRVAYDVNALADDGVVIVGDSFVWGGGVGLDDRFGNRLETKFSASGRPTKVYSFGIIGAGLTTYDRVLERIPEEDRSGHVVMAYYVNDMPPRVRTADVVRDQFIALGVGAPSLRVLGDLIGKSMTPSLERFNQIIVSDYDPSDPSFASRWKVLERDTARFGSLAARRSMHPPLLLILPLMVDFEHYPLEDGHRRLRDLGERLGFQVLDLLPLFRDRLHDGMQHLARPNDNHFDAATHDLVADALFEAFSARAASNRPQVSPR